MSELNVGYGVLDMRVGQPLDIVGYQLEKSAGKHLAAWYFDIIHTANQTPKALQVIGMVREMIRHATKLSNDKIIIHLNTQDKKLAARNELFKKAYENGSPPIEQKVIHG